MSIKKASIITLFAIVFYCLNFKSKAQCNFSATANYTTICKGDSVVLITKGVNPAGKAISFDGIDDYVNVPHSLTLDPAMITVESWFYLPAYPSGSNDNRRWIINKNYHEWTEGHYALMLINNQVGAYLNIGGTKNDVYGINSNISGGISLNKWYHLAMTYDNKTMKLYLDGVLVGSKFINKTRIAGTYPLAIGKRQDNYLFTNIIIDEVRIWNIARTQSQIRTAMNTSILPSSNGLAGYWKFDEGKDTLTKDETTNANNGTIRKGATWSTSAPAYITSCIWTPSIGLSSTNIPIVTGSPTNNITYKVNISSGCGSKIDSVKITVNNVIAPTITQNKDTLISSTATSYQWYLDTVIIANATKQKYIPVESGNYVVETISQSTCKAKSNKFNFTLVGNYDKYNLTKIAIYPNPFNEFINIEANNKVKSIEVKNIIGQIIYSANTTNSFIRINMINFESGVYLLNIKTDKEVITKKLIKE